MNSESWDRLSNWHNAWLQAEGDERDRLRLTFLADQPALAAEVDELTHAGPIAPGFLETPAFALSLQDLADEETPFGAGTEVGPYRIVELLARGGMGCVYRATDIRLGRDVALKVLSSADAGDEQRVDRFIQEARVTAALDRPNIVRLFDVGVHDRRPYLVMELLDGETLRARVARGPLTAIAARQVALEIASGLQAAHAAGLVHRDLKPENVFLTRSGITKILDFGVAKLVPAAVAATGSVTVSGTLVGTAGYLAPEQILGEAVDARADLFALGAILFEMLTGRRPFGRAHTVDTLFAILHDPAPSLLDELPDVPPTLKTIVTRLLEKSPGARFQSPADLAWALEQAGEKPIARDAVRAPQARARTRRWKTFTAIAAAGAVAAAVAGWRLMHRAPAGPNRSALAQFSWTLPEGTVLSSPPVVSPDGRRIVFAGSDAAGGRLFIRDLASLEARTVAGTEGARQPFWSPDSRSVGFFARGKLVKVALDGGAPVGLADVFDSRGGTWSPSGTIVFQPNYRDSALFQVPAAGGAVRPVTVFDVTSGETSHRYPSFLPDGVHFLYHVVGTNSARRGVYVGRIDRPAERPGTALFQSESPAIYVSRPGERNGVLLSPANGRVEVRAFDSERLALLGDARTIPVAAVAATPHQPSMLSVSADTLAFTSSPIPFGSHLAVISRDGNGLQVLSDPHLGGFLRVSPDGRRLVRAIVEPLAGNPDLWVEDLERHTLLRVTSGRDFDVLPTWSPDGRRLAFRSGSYDHPEIRFASADGTGITGALPCPRGVCEPTDWSVDGRTILVNVLERDVWMVPVDPNVSPRPLLDGSFTERDARFSPDGRWIAYVSDESGRPEVSVRSIVGPPRRFVVTSGGGDQPVWRRDGTELFYANADGLLHSLPVHFDREGSPVFGRAMRLSVPRLGVRHWGTEYDVSPDGAHVYFPKPPEARSPREIKIALGWSTLLD